MVRKMAYIGFAYLAGLFFASFLYAEYCLILAAALALAAVLFWIGIGKRKTAAVVCAVSFCVGAAYYAAFDIVVYNSVTKSAGQNISAEAKIISAEAIGGDRSAYTVNTKINGFTAKLLCYGNDISAEIGDTVKISGKAVLPENSFGFGAADYYKAKGIYLTVSLDNIGVIQKSAFSLRRIFHKYREFLASRMFLLIDGDNAGIAAAIVLGDKNAVSDKLLTELYRAGTGHMMAVSGAHLAVVCAIVEKILGKLPFGKKMNFVLMMLPACAFVLLADMSPSVVRSAVMVAIVFGADLFGRKADTVNSIGVAIVALSVGNPLAVRDASFILSVLSVMGIAVIAPNVIEEYEKKRPAANCVKAFIYAACASAAVLPASMLYFDEISVISPITSIVMMPFCTGVLVCGVIVAASGGLGLIAVPTMKICGVFCNIIAALADVFGESGEMCIPTGYFVSHAAVAAAVIAVIFSAIKFKNIKKVSIAAICAYACVIVCVGIYRYIPSDYVSAAVIKDKSAAVLIIHDKKSASVIDLCNGGKASAEAAKYLRRLGIERVDLLALDENSAFSEASYMGAFALENVETVLMPKNLSDDIAPLGNKTEFYSENYSADLPKYSVCFNGNGIFTLNVNNSTVVFFNSSEAYPEQIINCFDYCSEDNIGIKIYNNGKISSEVIGYGYCQ